MVCYKHSITHALIHPPESTQETLDKGSFGCGILVDLQKPFYTTDHNIQLHKLEYNVICGVCNGWFKFYLTDYKQFVFITGYNFDLMQINCAVPEGSVLGLLLFLIYINDLHKIFIFFLMNW